MSTVDFFFFSSRRRHTRLQGDWSSDVCSSDLTNILEIHKDAVQKGQRVIIVDDLLATGGTAEATTKLATSLGAEIAGLGFVVELDFLKGRDKLRQYDVYSLLHYDK